MRRCGNESRFEVTRVEPTSSNSRCGLTRLIPSSSINKLSVFGVLVGEMGTFGSTRLGTVISGVVGSGGRLLVAYPTTFELRRTVLNKLVLRAVSVIHVTRRVYEVCPGVGERLLLSNTVLRSITGA